MIKERGLAVSLHEERRNGRDYVTEFYDFDNGFIGPTFDVSFSDQRVRVWLDLCLSAAWLSNHSPGTARFVAGITAQEQTTLRDPLAPGHREQVE
jgi:hypothetical protein